MQLAKTLMVDDRLHGVLVLDEAQISDEQLDEKWHGIEPSFGLKIMRRIALKYRLLHLTALHPPKNLTALPPQIALLTHL